MARPFLSQNYGYRLQALGPPECTAGGGCQSQAVEAQRGAVTCPQSHSQWLGTEWIGRPEPQTFCSDVSSSPNNQTLGFSFCPFSGSGTKEPGARPKSCQGCSQTSGGWDRSVLWCRSTSGGRNHGSGPPCWMQGNILGEGKLVRELRGPIGRAGAGCRVWVSPGSASPPPSSPSVCLGDSTVTVMLDVLSRWSEPATVSWNR